MMEKKRLSFYTATVKLKDNRDIQADAIILPHKDSPVYKVRRAGEDTFEFIEIEKVKSLTITNKD